MFRSSSNLAAAYGIAVTLDMLITTVLTFCVALWLALPAGAVRGGHGLFCGRSCVLQFQPAQAVPGRVVPAIDWRGGLYADDDLETGRYLLNDKLRSDAIDLTSFLEAVFVNPPTRVEGTAVFLSAEYGAVPNALLHNLKHNKVLHSQNLFVTVRNHEVPWIGLDGRLQVEPLGHDCWQVSINYGFKNDPMCRVPAIAAWARL